SITPASRAFGQAVRDCAILLSGRSLLLLVLGLQSRDDGWIRESRGISERFPFGNIAQQAPHDLSRACLRQIRGEQDLIGTSDRADLADHVLLQLLGECR